MDQLIRTQDEWTDSAWEVISQFDQKKVLIWGYGREGKSTEHFLKTYCRLESITIFEGKPEELDMDGYDYVFKSPGIIFPEENDKIIAQTDLFLQAFGKQVIGITGTKGKSTTSAMLSKVLGECSGHKTILLGNIGLPCLDYFGEIETDTLVVFEMSCHQLAHAKLSPHVAVFLNLFEEHLDYYKTMDAYFAAKSHVLSWQQAGDVHYVGENVPDIASGGERRVIREELSSNVTLSIYGEHNRLNAAFVYAIATQQYGCVPEEVQKSIAGFTGLPHRLQLVGKYHGIDWYDDSISTIPEAAIQAVESIPNIKTILIGGMDRGIHYGILERFMVERRDINFICMYATGERILEELKGKDSASIESGEQLSSGSGLETDLKTKLSMEKESNVAKKLYAAQNLYTAKDLAEGVALAAKITPAGMGCVLSPAAPSYGYFKNFEERGEVFSNFVRDIG